MAITKKSTTENINDIFDMINKLNDELLELQTQKEFNYEMDSTRQPMKCNLEISGINIHGIEIEKVKIDFEYNSFSDLSEEAQNNYLQLLKDLIKNR